MTLTLIKLAQEGDKKASEQLIKENTGLIWSIVKRFLNRGHLGEDLFQVGCIGMLKAIKNFDTEFNVVFSTYAVPMITGEIRRFLRDDGIIKISRSIKENQGKIVNLVENFCNKNAREPTIDEISEMLKMDKEDVLIAMDASKEVFSMDFEMTNKDSSSYSLEDKIPDEHNIEKEIIDKVMVGQLIESLTMVGKKLIVLRYFKDKTQSQTAAILGMTQVQVSRMEKKILEQLRNSMN